MFSKTEELNYLTDLLLSASQWQCSENEPLSPLHLEVKDRIRRLTEQETINVVGVPSDQIEGREQREQNARERKSESNKKYHDKYKENKVRVDGKWVLREDAVQVPRANGVGWKWALKSAAQEAQEPPEDEHQCLSY